LGEEEGRPQLERGQLAGLAVRAASITKIIKVGAVESQGFLSALHL